LIGPTGSQGISGLTGVTGPQGAFGPTGATGPDGSFNVSSSPPIDPEEGDTWFDDVNARFYIYYDYNWIEVNANRIGPTGPTGLTGALGPTGAPGVGLPTGEDLQDGSLALYNLSTGQWEALNEIDGGTP
jgi:hypothetical protein